MKVTEISTYQPKSGGGLEGVVNNISTQLAAKDHTIEMYYRGKYSDKSQWEVHAVRNLPSILGHTYYNYKISRQDFNSDIIHCHGQNGVWQQLQKPDIPVITTFHGTYKGVEKVRGKFYNPLIQFEKIGAQKSDQVVACSHQVKKELQDFYNISEDKIAVIHNGVDTEKFHPISKEEAKKDLDLDPDQKYLCWIGGTPQRKGLPEAKQKVQELEGYKLIIAGQKGENTDKIKYLGRIPDEKLNSFYNASEALIFPTKYEGHPLVVLESLATHTPVITTEAANVEIAEKEKHYILLEENTTDEIKEFLEKTEDRDFSFIQKYTWKKVAEKYEQLFQELV